LTLDCAARGAVGIDVLWSRGNESLKILILNVERDTSIMNGRLEFLVEAGPALSGRVHRWRRAVNTFLAFPFLFDFVIKDRHFVELIEGRTKRNLAYLLERLLQKSLWFWPRIIDAKPWVSGRSGDRQRPDNFIALDAHSSRALCDAIGRYASSKEAPILDLGCNVGRHLDVLRRNGFANLTGVDAMAAAFERMLTEFPETAKVSKLHHDLFQRFLRQQPDQFFDVLYSHGATIELVHPSFDIVKHMCRVTKHHVVLIQNEIRVHPYPRFWTYEFARNGFFLREARRPVGDIPPANSSAVPSLLVYCRYR
jgi:SAM-dependent methyltransferase